MKTFLPLLITLLLTGVALGQEPKTEKVVKKNAKGVVQERYTLVDGRKAGLYESFHESGKPASRGSYADGQRSGAWTWWHAGGKKSFEGTFAKGLLQGPAVDYYSSGARQYEGTFDEGRLKGQWTWYHENGKAYKQGRAYTSGLNSISSPEKGGRWKHYFDTGVLSFEGTYVENKLNGRAVDYYASGKPQYEGFFDYGRLNGPWTHYHQNGKVYARGDALGSGHNSISSPVKTGSWKWYFESGTLSFEGTYAKDVLQGPAVDYYQSGARQHEGTFKDGRLTGRWTHYHENGKVYGRGEAYTSGHNSISSPKKTGPWKWYHNTGALSFEGTYEKDVLQGPAADYYASGARQYEGAFKDGRLAGRWTHYHENGKVYARGEAYTSGHNSISSPKKTGPWKWYYDTGTPSFEGTYVKDILQGPAVDYYRSKGRQYEGTFKDGRLAGRWIHYHENGKVYGRGEAYTSGHNSISSPKKTGPWKWFYDTGSVSFEGTYQKDLLQGPATDYYRSGARQYTGSFKDGRLQGPWTQYFENGKVYARGSAFTSGLNSLSSPKKAGRWLWFYDDGTPQFDGFYVNDMLDGRAVRYHSNGKAQFTGRFVEGRLKGSWEERYREGGIRARGTAYSSGFNNIGAPHRTGLWTFYHPNGKKQSEGRYHKNRKVGPWIAFDEEGRVSSVKNHFAGSEEEGAITSSTDPNTGATTHVVENPGGSHTRITVDRDGNITSRERIPAPGEEPPSVSYTNPDTGKTITVTTDEDGHRTVTLSSTTEEKDGTRRIREEDLDGTTREITESPDGGRTVRETRTDGTIVESGKDPSGTLRREVHYPDGTSKTFTRSPDGKETLTRRDAEGSVVLEAVRDPSGVEERTYPDGTRRRRHLSESGDLVETIIRPDGTRSRILYGKDGKKKVVEASGSMRDPGQIFYEDVTGGENWKGLTDEEKKHYAGKEEKLYGSDVMETAKKKETEADEAAIKKEREEAREELEKAAADLSKKPAADTVPKPNRLLTDAEDRKASMALKGLEWVLNLPDAKLKMIQEELTRAIKDDPALVKELLSTKRKDLIGFLNRHPGIMKNWEEKVAPALTAGTSVISAALSVTKAVDQAYEGKYAEALQSFLDAGAAGLKAIPPGELAKIQSRLGRNPAPIALAVKDLIGFGHEAFRDDSKQPRNWGKLLKDGVGVIHNLYQSLPDEQRKHFIERQWKPLRNALKKLETKAPGAKTVLGMLDAAPEIWKLFSEWNTGKRWVNISNLAQKLGPKVVGALVKASTKSDAAAEMVETVVQLGADYMGHLGAEARKATAQALKQAGQEANAYALMRKELNLLALKAGLSKADDRDYDFLSQVASGHRGSITLSDMRRKKNLLGLREAMQAWRRVLSATGGNSAAVYGFYNSLTDAKSRDSDDEDAYQRWLEGHVDNARLTLRVIGKVLPLYASGSAGRKFLTAWRYDLRGMVQRFG